MPNWCSTTITINSKNIINLGYLFERLKEWTLGDKQFCDNGFGKNWLGNIVGFSGIGDPLDDSKWHPRCRGEIVDIMFDSEGQIVIWTETAWTPMIKMWRMIVDKYVPDAQLLYSAEEFGCDIYCSNDPYEIGRYYMCSDFDCDRDWDSYDLLESQVIERLQEILKSKSSNINFLMSEAYKKADLEGIFLSIHRCEDVDIDEWD